MPSNNEETIENIVAALLVIDHKDPEECRTLLTSIAILIQTSYRAKNIINKESN